MSLEEKNIIHLMKVKSEIEAELVQSLLTANGVFSTKKYGRHPSIAIGIFSSDGNPFGGIDIYVREEDEKKAQEIVKSDIDHIKQEEGEQESSKKEGIIHLIFKIFIIIFVLVPILAFFINVIYLFLHAFFKQ